MLEHSDQEGYDLQTMRHSCAHLMASAIQKLWPETIFGVGPAIATGFYYDVAAPVAIGPEELDLIEREMIALRDQSLPFVRETVPIDSAIEIMRTKDQPLKVELLQLLKEKGTTAASEDTGDPELFDDGAVSEVTFYSCGSFSDLCRGPHVGKTSQVGAFKLLSSSGAFWRGDSRNRQLTRIHGACFETPERLKQHLTMIEEAKKRDHRKLNIDLGIFHLSDDVGSGLPLWLPNGTVLREELEFLAKREEWRDGYLRVVTPVITHERLYYRSGHLPYYKDDMYAPIDIEGEKFYLRPMNCPHHHEVYLSGKKSYRDLPVRLAEYGTVYRYERSGVVSGIMRSRSFTQNDAHIYCRYDQARDEIARILAMHERYYKLFAISEHEVLLALPDERRTDKFVTDPARWFEALTVLRDALAAAGIKYREAPGEAAFYGPKIDFMIKNAIGTEYAISTAQLDFLASDRFDLKYVDEGGSSAPVYVIHRAPLGSHERFVAFLIEHYAGIFPTWLSPVQVRVIPIADRHVERAQQVCERLRGTRADNFNGGIRVDVDASKERMQKKIRNAQTQHIPYMLVIGDKEQETDQVSVRHRSAGDMGMMPLDVLANRIVEEIATRHDLAADLGSVVSEGARHLA